MEGSGGQGMKTGVKGKTSQYRSFYITLMFEYPQCINY